MRVVIKVKFIDQSIKEFILDNYFPGQAARFVKSLENVKAWKLIF